jgi:hypothetical protein
MGIGPRPGMSPVVSTGRNPSTGCAGIRSAQKSAQVVEETFGGTVIVWHGWGLLGERGRPHTPAVKSTGRRVEVVRGLQARYPFDRILLHGGRGLGRFLVLGLVGEQPLVNVVGNCL